LNDNDENDDESLDSNDEEFPIHDKSMNHNNKNKNNNNNNNTPKRLTPSRSSSQKKSITPLM